MTAPAFPRHLAVRILTQVLSQNRPLDEVLNEVSVDCPREVLPWLQEISSGTLRWKGRLDFIINSVATQKKPSGWLRKVLLLASYQILVQNRAHAGLIVSEAVSLVKKKEGEAPARFVNACLRKISGQADQWRAQKPSLSKGSSKELKEESSVLAQWASLPEWIWTRLVDQYGLDWAMSYAEASLERPKLWVRSPDLQWTPTWGKPGPVPGSWESIEKGSIPEREGFTDGKFIVQDISSQLLMSEVTAVVQSLLGKQNLTALDLCSAPGGKAVGMAWSGMQVVATEKLESRVPLLIENVKRVAPEVEIRPWGDLDSISEKELLWVDAPCSGSGILRRHPDIRWVRQEKELPALVQTQEELVHKGWSKVKPGGFLVYSVCSVLKEEGIQVVEKTGLKDRILKTWSLCPQDAPHGDGFTGVLLRK